MFGAPHPVRTPLWDPDYICLHKTRQPRADARKLLCAGLLMTVAAGAPGCGGASATAPARRAPADGAAVTIAPPVHHARLPRHHRTRLASLCRLCDEYDLMEITSDADWQQFAAATGLDSSAFSFDFSHGHLVGVIAYVGTPMTPRWPLDIAAIGRDGDDGWVMATLRPTLYHANAVPGFCTFTYVGGFGRVSRVDVNPRSFVLQY